MKHFLNATASPLTHLILRKKECKQVWKKFFQEKTVEQGIKEEGLKQVGDVQPSALLHP